MGAAMGAMGAMGGGAGMNGGTGGCCPVCPNLQTIMNANVPLDESFGGPFAPAMESTQSGAPLTKPERDALKVIAEEAGIDETAAQRDPGMASSARARAASSLAGLASLGGAGGAAAAGAMGSMLRL